MPDQRIDVVRRSFQAWNENDWDALEAAYHPDVVADPPEGWPEGETAHGWDAVRLQFERLKDAWKDERVNVGEVERVRDQVLAQFQWIAQGRASGVDVANPMWGLFTVRNGRIVRLKYFFNRANALKATEAGD